jgi:hypothetical protein
MHGIIHPFSKALYEQDGAGHIKVSLDGKWGLFNIDGSYIECGWVGGPQIANHRVAAPALERH